MFDLLSRQPRFLEHRACVLSESRGVPAYAEWRTREGDGPAHHAVATFAWMLGGAEQLDRFYVRIVRQIFQAQDGHARDVDAVAKTYPFRRRMLRSFLFYHLIEDGNVLHTIRQALESLIGLEFGAAGEVVEVLPVLVRVGQDACVTILRAIRLARARE